MTQPDTKIIRDHNDRFRAGDLTIPGTMFMTRGLMSHMQAAGLPEGLALRLVQEFNTFTEDNDPHGEHDFGAFDLAGARCFWKIDLYDPTMRFGTEEPTNPSLTHRVLTIMLASDY